MKKIYSLVAIALLSATAVNAQENLVANPGFENWTGNQPVSYAPFNTYLNTNLTQENTIKHTGNSAARHQSQSSTIRLEQDNLMTITPGNSYTISYWYYDNDPAARTRIYSSWMRAGSPFETLTDNADVLMANEYSADSPQWVNKTLTLTAPANATHFKLQVRTYGQDNNSGGYIYYDDFSFVDNTPAGIAQNGIENLKLYPNPLTGNVLNIASAANAAKTVAIFDMTGKQVLNTTTANGTVNTGSLTAGVYLVKVTEEGKTATKKLIVQ